MEIRLEYLEKLIRDSERLDIIKTYTKGNEYIRKEELMTLLGIKKTEEESNAD